jgi:hypothetical protein
LVFPLFFFKSEIINLDFMKRRKSLLMMVITGTLIITFYGCTKNSVDTSALYTPTSSNVTANATLSELQQGRVLYINSCGQCHGLISPDSYSPAQWKTILSSMTPRTNLSSSDAQLVTKYVCKGNQ